MGIGIGIEIMEESRSYALHQDHDSIFNEFKEIFTVVTNMRPNLLQLRWDTSSTQIIVLNHLLLYSLVLKAIPYLCTSFTCANIFTLN